MGYKRTVYRSDNCIEWGYCFNGSCGAKGEQRAEKKKPTPEQIKKQNQRNKENLVRRTIQLNFYPNDYWVCLKYQRGTGKTYEDVKDDFNKFLRRMRNDYRIRGEEFKYIYRIEIGRRGGIHIHILFNRIWGADLLTIKNWVNNLIHFTMLRDEGGYRKIASYITKPLPEDSGQLCMFTDDEKKAMSKYGSSRNLIRPEPEVKEYRRRTVRKLINEGPEATKGFYIDKSSLHTGINEYTGYSYLYYTEIRIAPIQRVVHPPNDEGGIIIHPAGKLEEYHGGQYLHSGKHARSGKTEKSKRDISG